MKSLIAISILIIWFQAVTVLHSEDVASDQGDAAADSMAQRPDTSQTQPGINTLFNVGNVDVFVTTRTFPLPDDSHRFVDTLDEPMVETTRQYIERLRRANNPFDVPQAYEIYSTSPTPDR